MTGRLSSPASRGSAIARGQPLGGLRSTDSGGVCLPPSSVRSQRGALARQLRATVPQSPSLRPARETWRPRPRGTVLGRRKRYGAATLLRSVSVARRAREWTQPQPPRACRAWLDARTRYFERTLALLGALAGARPRCITKVHPRTKGCFAAPHTGKALIGQPKCGSGQRVAAPFGPRCRHTSARGSDRSAPVHVERFFRLNERL